MKNITLNLNYYGQGTVHFLPNLVFSVYIHYDLTEEEESEINWGDKDKNYTKN